MTRLFQLAAIILMITIAYLSLLPISGQPSIAHADKIQHLLAYGALAGLIGLGWPRLHWIWVIALAAGFGLGVEIAQGLSGTGRTPSALDALANLAGAALATLALFQIRARRVQS